MSSPASLLPSLPDEARVWVHPTTAPLADDVQRAVLDRLDTFVDKWTNHDQAVRGGTAILHDRFVILAGIRADGEHPSGCAIDDATRAINAVAETAAIEWVPSLHVMYQTDEGTVAAVSRSTFKNRVETGTITTETTVFDPSVTTLGEIREGAFEQPAGQSWHANAFSLPTPA